MTPTPSRSPGADNDAPNPSGELAYRIHRDFLDLTRLDGFEKARETVAHIMVRVAERKPL